MCQLSLNWPNVCGEKALLIIRQCILAMSSLCPLTRRHDPSFELNWIMFIPGIFVPSLVQFGQVVQFVFSLFCFYLPFSWTNLNMAQRFWIIPPPLLGALLEQSLITWVLSSTLRLVEIDLVAMDKMKMTVRLTDVRRDRQANDRIQMVRNANLSF